MKQEQSYVLTIAEPLPGGIDGATFQVHQVTPGVIKLYRVEIRKPDVRCPVVIAGERCGEVAGHEGKHCWGGGD